MDIFFRKNLLLFFFYFYSKFIIITCQDYCLEYTECYQCALCENENLISCRCVWTASGCSYSSYMDYYDYEDWYSKITTCYNLETETSPNKVYCPTSKTKTTIGDLDKDNSITYSMQADSKGLYGKNMIVCTFEYEQSTEHDLKLNFEFAKTIAKYPKVYVESTDVSLLKSKTTVDASRELEFSQSVKVVIKVLLKDDYTTPPIKIKLSLKFSKYAKIFSTLITAFFIILLLGCAIFCVYRMYKNNEARRQARMFLYQQARENMARIEQENNYDPSNQEDSIDIEAINKEKLDKLFNGKMAQHLYKKEYNQFGGGCSICLAEFKKKSKVSITSCKHVFHYKCIHDWLYKNIRNPKCPNCNHEIMQDVDETNIKKEKDNKIIKIKRKSVQANNNNNINNNQNVPIDINGAININNGSGSNIDVSQSQRPQLGGEY